MTMIEVRPSAPTVPARSGADVVLEQLSGIAAWARDHRPTALVVDALVSREARLDLARRRDVVERQRQALIDWTARQLLESDHVLCSLAVRRAVVVHRNDWFKGKVAAGLEADGISVVAALENGAEAVGVVVAEQPDVLLLENKLPMLPGLEVTRAVRRYSPRTAVVAQVESDMEIGPFLDAGAITAYPRRVPPADIVAAVRQYLVA